MGDSIGEHYRGSLREIIEVYIIAHMIGTQSPKDSTAAVRATRVFEVGTNVSIYKPISGSFHFIFHCPHITPLGSPWGLQPVLAQRCWTVYGVPAQLPAENGKSVKTKNEGHAARTSENRKTVKTTQSSNGRVKR